MRRIASVSVAAMMAVASVDLLGFAADAQARSRGHSAPSRSFTAKPQFKPRVQQLQKNFVPKNVVKKNFVPKTLVQKNLVPKNLVQTPQVLKGNFKYVPKYVAKGSANTPLAQQILARRNLPLFKPAIGTGPLKSRLAVPQNLQPKLTLVKAPKIAAVPRFSPFIQRHWKHAFFWVAVAGIGYVTVPHYYYDKFVSYVDEDDPDYDRALGLLSLAALDDEDNIVRVPRPASTPYRYSAPVAPPKSLISAPETTDPTAAAVAGDENKTACTLKPFVDRKWNREFVWVQVPEVGDVTVPEDIYDRFVGFVSGAPPNYDSACTVLAEAAAADTISVAVQNTSSSVN